MREGVIQTVENPVFEIDGQLHIYSTPPPPPSRANSELSRQLSLPGYVEECETYLDEDENLPPPPSYIDCTIPPPIYEELYPVPRTRTPKVAKQFTRRTWFKLIFFLGFVSIGISLLVIATRSAVNQSCNGNPFLLVWCFVACFVIFIGLTLVGCKKLRKRFNEWTSLRPIILYLFSVFCISWLIGGSVISFEIVGEVEDCSGDVVSITFATCVIGFLFGAFFFCFQVSG